VFVVRRSSARSSKGKKKNTENFQENTVAIEHKRAVVNGTRNITGDTDLRLRKFFGLSKGYFLRHQNVPMTR
jgi:plasmid maintenance system antidote protein VapI